MNRIPVLIRHDAVYRSGSANHRRGKDTRDRPGSDHVSRRWEPAVLRVGFGRPSRVSFWALTHLPIVRVLAIVLTLAMMIAVAML